MDSQALKEAMMLRGSFWSDRRLAYGLLPVTSLLEKRGLDVTPLLARVGIDQFGLMDPSYTMSGDTELDLMRGVIRALDDPSDSLALAREYRVRGFSVLGLAMLSSDTPLRILHLLLRFPRLAWGAFGCETRQSGKRLAIDLIAPPNLGVAEGFLAERDTACAQIVIEEVLGRPLRFEKVRFRHVCRADVSVYEDFFDCPVQFNAEGSGVEVPLAELIQAMPHANEAMRIFYEAQCERMSRNLEKPFRFADAVVERLQRSEVIPDLPGLAQEFYMTARTLQRRLSAEHVSFAELLKRVRRQRADRLLSETSRSMESISAELGFSDAVAFSHAYKSWTGQPPIAFRHAHQHP